MKKGELKDEKKRKKIKTIMKKGSYGGKEDIEGYQGGEGEGVRMEGSMARREIRH